MTRQARTVLMIGLAGLILTATAACGGSKSTTSGPTTLEPPAAKPLALVLQAYPDDSLEDQLAQAADIGEKAAQPRLVVIVQMVGDASRPRTYVIRPDDSVCAIAQHFQLTCAEVIRANPQLAINGRNPSLVHPGEFLTIPTPGQPASTLIATAAPPGSPRPTPPPVPPLPEHPTLIQIAEHDRKVQRAKADYERDLADWTMRTRRQLEPWIADFRAKLSALSAQSAVQAAIADPRKPTFDSAMAIAANTLSGFDAPHVLVALGTGNAAVPSLRPLAEIVPDVELVVAGVTDPSRASAWRASARDAGINGTVLDPAQTQLRLVSLVARERSN